MRGQSMTQGDPLYNTESIFLNQAGKIGQVVKGIAKTLFVSASCRTAGVRLASPASALRWYGAGGRAIERVFQ